MRKPILICGPTASGKSTLGISIAEKIDGCIINADALQVYNNWRVLTARPSIGDESRVPHHLYGHVDASTKYSVGAWLRDLRAILEATDKTPIILGGTGLYFAALTNGLVDIPSIPASIRAKGDEMREQHNTKAFMDVLEQNDPETFEKTDKDNAMRLQRAWEVLETTGRGLASWQKDTPPPLMDISKVTPVVLNSNVNWLNARIEMRFGKMIENGALKECEVAIENGWEPSLPSSRALGATEIIAYLQGEMNLYTAAELANIATRQFAKRQRSWFRNKMKIWHHLDIDTNSTEQLTSEILQYGNPT